MSQLKIMQYQLLLVLIAACVALAAFYDQVDVVKAVLYGGITSLLTTGWLALRIEQASRSLEKGKKKSAFYVYLGAFEKFILALVLLGFGIVSMKMHPLPLIAGLVAGQIGFVIGSYKLNN